MVRPVRSLFDGSLRIKPQLMHLRRTNFPQDLRWRPANFLNRMRRATFWHSISIIQREALSMVHEPNGTFLFSPPMVMRVLDLWL